MEYDGHILNWGRPSMLREANEDSDEDMEDMEDIGDGRYHVFDYGEDCPFEERYYVIFPNGDAYCLNDAWHTSQEVSYYDGEIGYSTREEMEECLEINGITPREISRFPEVVKKFIRRVEKDNDF